MPETPLLQSPRNRFFAFSAVGVAMVCLPLWQVLRYQQSELRELAAERALLDPVAKAVHAQFGLLAHRQVSAQVLQGRPQLEATRRALQTGVDEHLQTLALELTQGLWTHALAETRDLTRDWQALVQKVARRAVNAAQSDHLHALRLEQAVQVMDLVAAAETASDSSAASAGHHRFAAAAKLMTGLAIDLHLAARALESGNAPATAVDATRATADATGAPLTPDTLAAWQGRLHNRLQALETALNNSRRVYGEQVHPDAASQLTAALALVDQHSRAYLQALNVAQRTPVPMGTGPTGRHGNSATPDAVQEAWQQAQDAQLALFQQALVAHKQSLARHGHQLEQQRAALLAAMGLLSALALSLAATLVQRLSPRPTTPEGPDDARSAGWAEADRQEAQAFSPLGNPTPTRTATARLLQRLRDTPAQNPAGATTTRPRESEDTLPPERS